MVDLKWAGQHFVLKKLMAVQELASLVLKVVAYTYQEREGLVLIQVVQGNLVLKSLQGAGPQNLLEEGLTHLVLNSEGEEELHSLLVGLAHLVLNLKEEEGPHKLVGLKSSVLKWEETFWAVLKSGVARSHFDWMRLEGPHQVEIEGVLKVESHW